MSEETIIKTKAEALRRLQTLINEFQRDLITPRKMEVLTYSISRLFFMLNNSEKNDKLRGEQKRDNTKS